MTRHFAFFAANGTCNDLRATVSDTGLIFEIETGGDRQTHGLRSQEAQNLALWILQNLPPRMSTATTPVPLFQKPEADLPDWCAEP